MDRMTVIPWLLWAALVVSFVGCVKTASAQVPIPLYVHESEAAYIRLMSSPCEHLGILQFLAQNGGDTSRFKAIESEWAYPQGKKAHVGCWMEFTKEETGTEAAFGMMFDDGERFIVPKSEFLKKQGVGV